MKQRSLELTVALEQARQTTTSKFLLFSPSIYFLHLMSPPASLALQEQLRQRDAEIALLRRQQPSGGLTASTSLGSQALASELAAVRARVLNLEEQLSTSPLLLLLLLISRIDFDFVFFSQL